MINLPLLIEISAFAWAVVLQLVAVGMLWRGWQKFTKDGSPPGWAAAWLGFVTCLLIAWYAGLGVAAFDSLVSDGLEGLGVFLLAFLGPWLAYKGVKYVSNGKTVELGDG